MFILTILVLALLFILALALGVFMHKFENQEIPRPPPEPTLSEEVQAMIHMSGCKAYFIDKINRWIIGIQYHGTMTIYAEVMPHASFSEWQRKLAEIIDLRRAPLGVYHPPQI